MLPILNRSGWDINRSAQLSLSGDIVQLWREGDVEVRNVVAEAEVDGVVAPWVAEVQTDASAGEGPGGAVRGHGGDVCAWEGVLVTELFAVAAPFGVGDHEVRGSGAGEKREGGEDGEGLHCDGLVVGEAVEYGWEVYL